mmetsp:Transcript_154818/g.288633  ORF Transcript_154818/g.288633 Transcript_154818/m.288633 type:complete len:200 (-) Transcript_154818:868-1467(-)
MVVIKEARRVAKRMAKARLGVAETDVKRPKHSKQQIGGGPALSGPAPTNGGNGSRGIGRAKRAGNMARAAMATRRVEAPSGKEMKRLVLLLARLHQKRRVRRARRHSNSRMDLASSGVPRLKLWTCSQRPGRSVFWTKALFGRSDGFPHSQSAFRRARSTPSFTNGVPSQRCCCKSIARILLGISKGSSPRFHRCDCSI